MLRRCRATGSTLSLAVWGVSMLVVPGVLLEPEAAHGDGALVVVDRNRVNPGTLTIAAGETVTFRADEDETLVEPMLPFTIVGEDGSFRSPPLEPGDSWRHTFERTGLYRYRLERRRHIEGTIVVE